MPVPDYQTLMLPILKATSDGRDHRISDLIERMSDEFRLSEDDRSQRIASGQRTIFNRTHWAVTYLAKAGLLARSGRGVVHVTERGTKVLGENPSRIDTKYLAQFPELASFTAKSRHRRAEVEETHSQTPDELLDATFQELRRGIEADLLAAALAAHPDFFEQIVLDLLLAMGYGGSKDDAARHVGKTGDDGIDGVIDEDRLGLDAVYVQAKRWDPGRPVRRPDLQGFAGSLQGQRAGKGVFITTSRFTSDAKEYVTRIPTRIVLIDGETLGKLMYDYGVGVRDHRQYLVRKVDPAYFEGDV